MKDGPPNVALLSELEKAIVAKLVTARFPPYTASKRFARDLADGHITRLSDRGRGFLAYVANRFRRQYQLSAEEEQWVKGWLEWHSNPDRFNKRIQLYLQVKEQTDGPKPKANSMPTLWDES
jgi:hypothetical protein